MVDHLLFGKKRPSEDFLPSNVVKPWCTYLGIPPIVVTSAVRYIALQAIAGVVSLPVLLLLEAITSARQLVRRSHSIVDQRGRAPQQARMASFDGRIRRRLLDHLASASE